MRLVALLRRHHLQSLWILDRTIRPALAAALAGIPERIGLGLGPQSAFITNDGIGQEHFHDHPIDWLRALMAAMKVPLSSTEPNLQVPIALLSAVGERFAQFARPWIAIGIGASHPTSCLTVTLDAVGLTRVSIGSAIGDHRRARIVRPSRLSVTAGCIDGTCIVQTFPMPAPAAPNYIHLDPYHRAVRKRDACLARATTAL